MITSQFLAIASLLIGALGVIIGAVAQMLPVRNEIDHYVSDLIRQGKVAKWAALLQMIATMALVARAYLFGAV